MVDPKAFYAAINQAGETPIVTDTPVQAAAVPPAPDVPLSHTAQRLAELNAGATPVAPPPEASLWDRINNPGSLAGNLPQPMQAVGGAVESILPGTDEDKLALASGAAEMTLGTMSGLGAVKMAPGIAAKIPFAKNLSGKSMAAFQTLAAELGYTGVTESLEQANQAAGIKKDTALLEDMERVRLEMATGLAVPGALKLGGKLIAGAFKGGGREIKAIGQRVDALLDKKLALAKTFTDDPTKFEVSHGKGSIKDALQQVKIILRDIAPDKSGHIFKQIQGKIEQEIPIVGKGIDTLVRLGVKRIKRNEGVAPTVSFKEIMDVSGVSKKLGKFDIPEDAKVISQFYEDQSENIVKRILNEDELRMYRESVKILNQTDSKLGRVNLLFGTKEHDSIRFLGDIGDKARSERSTAWINLDRVKDRVNAFKFTPEMVNDFKRSFATKADFLQKATNPNDVTKAALAGDMSLAFGRTMDGFMELAGRDVRNAYRNYNTRFAALKDALPLATMRQGVESSTAGDVFGGSVSASGGGIVARMGNLFTPSPQTQFGIAQGVSSLDALDVPAALTRGIGTGIEGVGRGISAVDRAFTPAVTGISSAMAVQDFNEATAEELQFKADLQEKSTEHGVDFSDYRDPVIFEGRLELDDTDDQADYIAELIERANDKGDTEVRQSHVARQSSTFNSRTKANIIQSLPKKKKIPKAEKVRQSVGGLSYKY